MRKKSSIICRIGIMVFLLTGCGDRLQDAAQTELPGASDIEVESSGAELPGTIGIEAESSSAQLSGENHQAAGVAIGADTQADIETDTDAERIAAVCRDIHAEAAAAGTLGSTETLARTVAQLGENGYVAASDRNQVDMAGAEQVLEFIRAKEQKESRTLTIVVVMEAGFRKFDLETQDGDVTIVRSYYQYDQNGTPQERSRAAYPADFWDYTPEGYLIFSGTCLSPETFVMTLSATPEHTALRVLPLEEECRELTRKYLLPIGYERNNMFLCSWTEEDYGNLDFYDIFDRFYPILHGQPLPYTAAASPEEEPAYWIPADEFEQAIMAYFNIDAETLRARTKYNAERNAYEYRPRGFYEAEYPDIPYPEVIGCRENPDGTITLTVNAVYPHDDTSKSFSHETVIRPLDENHFQYISNQMLPAGEDYDAWWHNDRLTEQYPPY